MTAPYYQDDLLTLYQGDCLPILAALPAESVDAVITDPPYSSGGKFRADRNQKTTKKYLSSDSAAGARLPDFDGDSRDQRSLERWSAMWLAECYRIARPGAAVAIFTDWRSLPVFSDALQMGGWTWRGVGVWVKPQEKSRPTMGGLWNDTEFILWGSKGSRTSEISTVCLPGTWKVAGPDSRTRHHVTEKPAVILDDLVRLAPDGGHVLDPFAGSGTTAVAAIRAGRRCTSIEQSDEYARIIADRIAALSAAGSDVATPPGFAGIFDAES